MLPNSANVGCLTAQNEIVFNLSFDSRFGPKTNEVTGEWRRLHTEELYDLYAWQNIIRVIKSRRMRWTGHVTRMEDRRGAYRVLVGRPKGKRPLGRPRRRLEDSIKIDLQEVGWGIGRA
jgi:hypothetical protein